jgi:DNA-binding transcriptional regulator YdaS (Cro superfamily)
MQLDATPFEALKAAIDQAGSQSAMARLCGVSQTAVWKWVQRGKRLPAELTLKVERGTGISRHLLRPDIYPTADSSLVAKPDIVDFDRQLVLKKSAA